MGAITKDQIKRVYALGAGAGIVDHGSKDDDLHALVYKLTGKTSVRDLSVKEFVVVEQELLQLLRLPNQPEPPKPTGRSKSPDVPGMMTGAQRNLAWRLIYRLCELDPRDAVPGDRMRGAIKKILGMDVSLTAPMAWINFDDGAKLIEQLKRYVRSAEARAKKRGVG